LGEKIKREGREENMERERERKKKMKDTGGGKGSVGFFKKTRYFISNYKNFHPRK